MQLFLKKLILKNYCSYENSTFNFTDKNGDPYPFICFYGPNGSGKSNLLSAISLLTMNNEGRRPEQISMFLRKMVRSEDYDPHYEKLQGHTYEEGYISSGSEKLVNMLVEGIYEYNGKEYVVQVGKDGYIRNDFVPIPDPSEEDEIASKMIQNSGPWGEDHLWYTQRISHIVRVDTEISKSKFQLHAACKDKFEETISKITSFKTECSNPTGLYDAEREYCTDAIIHKPMRGKIFAVHFKRMSAGEKKICKAFSDILNLMYSLEYPGVKPGQKPPPSMPDWPPIILIDNVEMDIYYTRHVKMIDCLKKLFNKQQIFATTHSGVLIERFLRKENDTDTELMIDLEGNY